MTEIRCVFDSVSEWIRRNIFSGWKRERKRETEKIVHVANGPMRIEINRNLLTIKKRAQRSNAEFLLHSAACVLMKRNRFEWPTERKHTDLITFNWIAIEDNQINLFHYFYRDTFQPIISFIVSTTKFEVNLLICCVSPLPSLWNGTFIALHSIRSFGFSMLKWTLEHLVCNTLFTVMAKPQNRTKSYWNH